MQINALNLSGSAAPSGESTGQNPAPGEFAAALHHVEHKESPPPRAPSPPGSRSLVSVIGTEEVSSKQPNAGAEKLDLLPTKQASGKAADPLFSAQFAWMVLPAGMPIPAPTTNQVGAWNPFSGGESIALHIGGSNPIWNLQALSGSTVAPSSTTSGEFFSPHGLTNPLPHGPFAQQIQDLIARYLDGQKPVQSPIMMAPATVIPTSEAQVSITGLTQQTETNQQVLDPKMLAELGLSEVSGWTTTPTPSAETVTLLDPQVPTVTARTPDTMLMSGTVSAPAVSVVESAVKKVLTPSKTLETEESAPQQTSAEDAVTESSIPLQVAKPIPPTNQIQAPEGANPKKVMEAAPILAESTVNSALIENSVKSTVATDPASDESDVAPVASPVIGDKTLPRTEQAAQTTNVKPLDDQTQREVMRQTIDRIDRMTIHRPMSQMVIRLNPQDLGEITMTVRSMGVRSEASIVSTNERVAQALEAERPRLIQAIENKGVSLGSLSLQFGGGKGEQAPASHQDFVRGMNLANALSGETAAVAVEAPAMTQGSGSLNLVI